MANNLEIVTLLCANNSQLWYNLSMTGLVKFKREDHVYNSEAFAELVKDAVRFFNGTPVLSLPLSERFTGAGVYAIYSTAKAGLYSPYGQSINRVAWNVPIYVGKAVPTGWRQNRLSGVSSASTDLYSRLSQHAKNIELGKGLKVSDFYCRFAIFEGGSEDMIAAIEAALIAMHSPLWNSVVDGFGNHDPGRGRIASSPSAWDVLHPGRPWASKLTGVAESQSVVARRVKDYFVGRFPSRANV